MQIAVWVRRAAIFAALLNIVAIGTHTYFGHKFASGGLPQLSGTMAPVAGVSTNGQIVAENSTRPCHIIRYTSIHCAYCRRDQPTWDRFDAALTKNGCDSTSLGPSGSDMPQNAATESARQFLVAVPASFAKRIDLFATPTTVVLDRNWNIVWSRVGMLDTSDIKEATAALGL
ncbi:MAG: hypothetical protein LAO78_25550 [Acidobacteriia bacterium]|nr:hypothetical protein [Terriglobia bacterium]